MKRLSRVALFLAVLWPGVLVAAPWLLFTEMSYRSLGVRDGDDLFEFVEILNLEAPHVGLGGWQLEGEVRFRFPRGIRLGAGECLVVARDPRAFAERFPRARR